METPKPKNKGGRPLGSLARITKEAREFAQETGLLPHEILLSMARGDPQVEYHVDEDGVITKHSVMVDLEQRKDAAKAAAPYYAPKISTVEVITGVGDDDLDSIIARLAEETGLGAGTVGEGEETEARPAKSGGRARKVLNEED